MKPKAWQNKLGVIATGLVSVPFVMSAFMKIKGGPEMAEGWKHFGWPEGSQMMVGVLEILSVLIYMIPNTTFIGAILLTGYLGGAIATHLRMQEAVPLQVIFGIVIWGALYLRDERLRQLLPFRK
ncbi:MAG: DoxX family protein [Bdellovibrionales bacterium]|nr:DoxX family protein [Bdellovibrionales bacterium]